MAYRATRLNLHVVLTLMDPAVSPSCSNPNSEDRIFLTFLLAGQLPTSPTENWKASGCWSWDRWWQVTSISNEALFNFCAFVISVAYLLGILCFLSRQKQFSKAPFLCSVFHKCSNQWNLGVMKLHPHASLNRCKNFSTALRSCFGGTATLAEATMNSITSISAKKA